MYITPVKSSLPAGGGLYTTDGCICHIDSLLITRINL